MNNQKPKGQEVYSITSFSDVVSSPVFYSVLVLTIVLGLTSIFGFLQNPRKLKSVVDVISHKVSVSDKREIRVVNQAEYLVTHNMNANKFSAPDYNRYSIFSTDFSLVDQKAGLKKVSFDYDITSKQFWGDLDTSRIESLIEETQRKNRDDLMIGAPIDPAHSSNENDSKYSMKVRKAFLIKL